MDFAMDIGFKRTRVTKVNRLQSKHIETLVHMSNFVFVGR